MTSIERASAKVITALLGTGSHVATLYISDKLTVRATRKRYRNRAGTPRKFRPEPIDITLTIGKPNYVARRFIKLAKKAGEPFPIKRVQVTSNSR